MQDQRASRMLAFRSEATFHKQDQPDDGQKVQGQHRRLAETKGVVLHEDHAGKGIDPIMAGVPKSDNV